MATFKTLQDRALEEVGYDASVSSSTPRTRMKRRINEWHRRILTRPGFSRLLRESYSYSFASVADQAVYGLPISSSRVTGIYESTNDRRLELKTIDWLRREDPGLSSSGTPWVYVPRGWYPVHTQPSDASAITFKSSSGSDTTQVLKAEYLNAAGQRLTASVTINGTTDTTLITSGCVELTALYLSAVCVGTVTVYEDSASGTALAVIPIGSTAVQHFHVQLWPTPGSAITYSVDLTRILADLVNDNEVPLIPEDFHDLLYLGAVCDEWRLKDDSRYGLVRDDLETRIRHLNDWVWNLPDYAPQPEPARLQGSRLGGWFPRGT